MASMNLLVANSAVAKARRRQVMKSRRHYAGNPRGLAGQRGQICVAFEADKTHFLADQHLRVRGTVRFMAALAAFLAHRRMLESEWPSFIAVALETTLFVSARHPHQARFETAVRIMAIHTAHSAFGNAVLKGLGEFRFHIHMAAFAKRVDFSGFADHKGSPVYGMAGRAGD